MIVLALQSYTSAISGLASHPGHETTKKQARGFGGMVSFRIKGDGSNASKFLKNLKVIEAILLQLIDKF